MHHMQEPQRARIKRTLDHMAEHDGNLQYDKYTGEIQYDGVKAPADIHLWWKWNKSVENGDWGLLKDE